MESPGGPAVAVGAPTVGVEEEFLLLDPRTGSVAAVAPEVIALAAAPHRVTRRSCDSWSRPARRSA